MRALVLLVAIALGLTACSKSETTSTTTTSAARAGLAKLTLTSTAFADQGAIPRQFTCDGDNLSPPVAWSGIPADTSELTLTVEDPDAPNGSFVHWVLYAINPGIASLGSGPVGEGTNGQNSSGKKGYAGPCPPRGSQHRYIFTLSALSKTTSLPEGATAAQLRAASPADSLLGQGRLTGIYGR